MQITPAVADWCDQTQNERKFRDFCTDHREQRYMLLHIRINFQAHKFAFASGLLPHKDHGFSASAPKTQRIADARQSDIAFSFLDGSDCFDLTPPIPADIDDIIEFREVIANLGITHEQTFAGIAVDVISLLDQIQVVARNFTTILKLEIALLETDNFEHTYLPHIHKIAVYRMTYNSYNSYNLICQEKCYSFYRKGGEHI